MKKFFSFCAMALLLAGCAKEYDDSALSGRVSELEKKVSELEGSVKKVNEQISGIKEITDALNGKDFVVSVQTTETGATLTFLSGKTVALTYGQGGSVEAPVVSIISEGGVLYWAVDGKAIEVDGKKVPVYQENKASTPVFSYENGHLYVTVDGEKTDLGEITAGVSDSIVKDIDASGEDVVITLSDNSTIKVPFAKAFKLVIDKTAYAVDADNVQPVEIPYTVENKTEKTIVDVYYTGGYEATVDAEKITVTPPTPFQKGMVLAYADSQTGLTSIVKLTFGTEEFDVTSDIDFLVEAEGGQVEINGISNVEFTVVPQVDWITVAETKSESFTVILDVAENQTYEAREGTVNLVRAADGETVLKTITIAQKAGEYTGSGFPAIDWSNKQAAAWYVFDENYSLPDGFTLILHIYPYSLNTSGMRVANFGPWNGEDSGVCNMLRFGQHGNNAELEWMVDTGEGRKQGPLVAAGFETEKWQAIALTADKENGYKMYLNGEQKSADNTFAYNENMGFGAFEFANSWGSSWRSAFDGRMAYLSVYNKALSANEIIKNIFTEPVSDACVGFWAMTEGKGSILAADPDKAIKEDINLAKMVRNDNDYSTQNYDFDASENITWTYGNEWDWTAPEEPKPEGFWAPDMNNVFFSATFPEESSILDNVTMEGWAYANEVSSGLKTFMGVENMFLVRWESAKLMVVGGQTLNEGTMKLSGEYKYTYNAAYPLNSWHHIAATYERNGQVILYLDGQAVAQGAAPDHAVYLNGTGSENDCPLGRTFFIGAAYDGRTFNGNLSHMRVYNKVLTRDEIRAAANNKDLTTADGLLANWIMDENRGNTLADASGNGVTATAKQNGSGNGVIDDYAGDVSWSQPGTLPELVFATGISLSASETTIYKGATTQVTATAIPDGAAMPSLTWVSSDETVLTVDATGLVKGVAAGTATVTAKNEDEGIEASINFEIIGFEAGNCMPDMAHNYLSVDWGTQDVSALNQLTVEWKMKAASWSTSYEYQRWGYTYTGTSQVNSVFGVEGAWLLRIGDAGIANNNLELADHNHPRSNYDFQTDEWYHVAVTYNTEDQTTKFYVNGTLVNDCAGTATSAANLTGAMIGNSYMDNSAVSRYFDGNLADLRVWKSIRTQKEIIAGMNTFTDTENENLLAYFKLDEGTDDFVNSAATDVTITPYQSFNWAGGRPADVTYEAPKFPGINARNLMGTIATIKDSEVVDMGDNTHTFQMRIYANSWHANNQVNYLGSWRGKDKNHGDEDFDGMEMRFKGSSTITSNHGNRQCDLTNNNKGDTMEAGRWYTLTVTCDGSKTGQNSEIAYQYYLDDKLIAEAAPSKRYGTGSSQGFQVGYTLTGFKFGYNSTSFYFDGLIGEIRMWNKVLTAAEIAATLETVSDPSADDFYAYWRVDEGEGNTLKDASGHGRDLIVPDSVTLEWSEAADK